MLITASALRAYTVRARDGEIGRVADVFFDDRTWTSRDVVVETGGWLRSRRVLLPPSAVRLLDPSQHRLHVDLTRAQVARSPGADADMPVSRQLELRYRNFAAWCACWVAGFYQPIEATMYPAAAVVPADATGSQRSDDDRRQHPVRPADPHLRSARKVTGHRILARDGEFGHVAEVLLDTDGWTVRDVVVETRNWLPGRRVLLAPYWVRAVSWTLSSVFVDLSREAIARLPDAHHPAGGSMPAA